MISKFYHLHLVRHCDPGFLHHNDLHYDPDLHYPHQFDLLFDVHLACLQHDFLLLQPHPDYFLQIKIKTINSGYFFQIWQSNWVHWVATLLCMRFWDWLFIFKKEASLWNKSSFSRKLKILCRINSLILLSHNSFKKLMCCIYFLLFTITIMVIICNISTFISVTSLTFSLMFSLNFSSMAPAYCTLTLASSLDKQVCLANYCNVRGLGEHCEKNHTELHWSLLPNFSNGQCVDILLFDEYN